MEDELPQREAERMRPPGYRAGCCAGPMPIGRRPRPWACPMRLGGARPVAAARAPAFFVATRRPPTPANDNALAARPPVSATAPGPVFKPVAAENVLYALSDEGLITLDDGTPARRERASLVDLISGKSSRTHASVRWSVPREEVRVVPVKFE